MNKLRTFIEIVAVIVFLVVISHLLLANSSSRASYWQDIAEEALEKNTELETKLTEAQSNANKVKALETELSTYKEENEKLHKTIIKLQSPFLSSKGTTRQLKGNKDILSLLFWQSDTLYKMNDKSFKFYSHYSCKEKYLIKEDLIFLAYMDHPIIDPKTDDTICYVSLSKKYGFVFSKTRPYFAEADKAD